MIKFGTGGFRGIIGDDFNKHNVQLIAQALAEIIKKRKSNKPVVIGYDNRFMSDFAARWFAETLVANNVRVYLYTGSVPTPSVMSATRDLNHDFGIMITASHNPYYFNGVKVFTREGYDADVEFTNTIEEQIREIKEIKTMDYYEAKRRWLITDYADTSLYLGHIKSLVSYKIKDNNLKLLYNNMNGVGVVGLGPLAKDLNIKKFDIIEDDHDAFFSFKLPNPTEEALIPDFANQVVEGGYDAGFATDSDGDRLGIIDEKGKYVSNNEILACLYYYLITKRGETGDIVINCATSKLIDIIAEKLGYKCHEVDVGFKNITSKMTETNALLGGESSGGLTMRGYIDGKDAVFSSALVMEMMILENKPISEIVESVKNYANFHHVFLEDFIPLNRDVQDVVREIENDLPTFDLEIIKYERYGRNFKFTFPNNSWVLIRLSGTEPAFRIFVEIEKEEDGHKLLADLKQYVDNIQGRIKKYVE